MPDADLLDMLAQEMDTDAAEHVSSKQPGTLDLARELRARAEAMRAGARALRTEARREPGARTIRIRTLPGHPKYCDTRCPLMGNDHPDGSVCSAPWIQTSMRQVGGKLRNVRTAECIAEAGEGASE